MKRLIGILVLTLREQRVVIAIVFVVMLAAAAMRHGRVTAKQSLPRLKTMNQTGNSKTQLTEETGSEPTDDGRK